MEFLEHDLKSLMEVMKARSATFLQSEVKTVMVQLLSAVRHLHDNWIIHRDLKTSNLLMNNRGMIKVADFGLARRFGSPMAPMTQLVVTLWYRAPELLLGAKEYTTAIDMWSIGCIFAELVNNEPLMQGRNELDQLAKVSRSPLACQNPFSRTSIKSDFPTPWYAQRNCLARILEAAKCPNLHICQSTVSQQCD
jgi:cell division cycle 2-like protein